MDGGVGRRNRSGGGNRYGGGRGRHGGRSPHGSEYRYVARHTPVVARPDDASPVNESSEIGRRDSEISSVDGVTNKLSNMSPSDYQSERNPVPYGVGNMSPNYVSPKLVSNVSEAENRTPEPVGSPLRENRNASYLSPKPFIDSRTPQEFERGESTSEGTSGKGEYEKSDFQHEGFSFDICEERNKSTPKLKPSLLVKNKVMRNEVKRLVQGDNVRSIRPGMILLKGFISLKDQVKLIKTCRDLGRGHGGFYQPGYRDGAKLHLKMMCLGKNWDPETSKYDDKRPIDEAKPPPIPNEFKRLVKGAIQECHAYLESNSKTRDVQEVLPSMSPNICIVNFYTKTGKLGLHQDKDESQESLDKGLPVVSFSLGDSADFLFGVERDIDKADKVVLESGDVLVFGGKSRHIFHGVSTINPDTAPKALLEETDLKPGRLNLTFREY